MPALPDLAGLLRQIEDLADTDPIEAQRLVGDLEEHLLITAGRIQELRSEIEDLDGARVGGVNVTSGIENNLAKLEERLNAIRAALVEADEILSRPPPAPATGPDGPDGAEQQSDRILAIIRRHEEARLRLAGERIQLLASQEAAALAEIDALLASGRAGEEAHQAARTAIVERYAAERSRIAREALEEEVEAAAEARDAEARAAETAAGPARTWPASDASSRGPTTGRSPRSTPGAAPPWPPSRRPGSAPTSTARR